MVTAVIEYVSNPSLGSLTIQLFPAGSSRTANDVAATDPITMTEATNQKGLWTGTTDAALTGLYRAEATIDSEFIFPAGFVYMTDQAVVHRINDVAGGDVLLADLTTVLSLLNAFITNGQALSFPGLVATSGRMTVVVGDAYYTIDGRNAAWRSGGAWPDLTDATVDFYVYDAPPNLPQVIHVAGYVIEETGDDQAVGVQFPASTLIDLPLGAVLNYAVRITLANGHALTPVVASNKFVVSNGIGQSS